MGHPRVRGKKDDPSRPKVNQPTKLGKEERATRALLLCLEWPGLPMPLAPKERMEEASGLALAAGLMVVVHWHRRLSRPRAGWLLSEDFCAQCHAEILEHDIAVVVVDAPLSPVQQRNLERRLGCWVIDRVAVILKIFSARARSREGKLQVALAQLTYQRSRLVRSWSHLERQRGRLGFIGGPGESQLEIDRRLLTQRLTRIKRALATVQRTRGLQRRARRRALAYPLVALVGYTNAGKSTLFNRLTDSCVDEADQLFSTLDPTLRALTLPTGQRVILADTVGFITGLPDHLVTAFQATLEEVVDADMIVMVQDATALSAQAQRSEVLRILHRLGWQEHKQPIIEVRSKLDLCSPAQATSIRAAACRDGIFALSAQSGEGLDDFLRYIERLRTQDLRTLEFTLSVEDGAALAWLHRQGAVLSCQRRGLEMKVTARLAPELLPQLERLYGDAAREVRKGVDSKRD